jgi:ABC-type transport system substrate-binding protein
MTDSRACYGTTPEIDRLLKEAMGFPKPEARKELLVKGTKSIAKEAFWVPICSAKVICAMHKDLLFQPAVDEIDRYFLASWP